MGGLELLVICGIIGGVVGYLLRKKGKNATAFSVLAGMAGSCMMTWLLTSILFASYLLMPVYGMFGAWLAMYVYKKM